MHRTLVGLSPLLFLPFAGCLGIGDDLSGTLTGADRRFEGSIDGADVWTKRIPVTKERPIHLAYAIQREGSVTIALSDYDGPPIEASYDGDVDVVETDWFESSSPVGSGYKVTVDGDGGFRFVVGVYDG